MKIDVTGKSSDEIQQALRDKVGNNLDKYRITYTTENGKEYAILKKFTLKLKFK